MIPFRKPRSASRSRAVAAYIATVCLAGLVTAALLPTAGTLGAIGTLVMLSLIAGASSRWSVRFARLGVRVTPGDSFVFASLIAVGPFAAPIVACCGVLGAGFGPDRRRPALRTWFNYGAILLAAADAAWVHLWIERALGAGSARRTIALLAAAGTFFLINTFLVALLIRLRQGRGLFAIWRRCGLWTASSTAASAVLALGLVQLGLAVGPAGLLLGLVGSKTIAGSTRCCRSSREFEQKSLQPLRQRIGA